MSHLATVKTDFLVGQEGLRTLLNTVFGNPGDSIRQVERRAAELLSGMRVIVWEGDPQTFHFSYVSPSAESLLGYPSERWVSEPDFWSGTVVHPEDRSEAIAYCALATGQGRDHDFRYRARAADGRTVLLHDVVHVIKGTRGVAARLRGIMMEIPDLNP